MPYALHPQVTTPEDNVVLWRYMDFTKLVFLLETSTLHFSHLSQFEDPFEGHLTTPTIDRFRTPPDGLSPEEYAQQKATGEHNLNVMRPLRDLPRVSCWHANRCESAAMWKLYAKSNEAVAVRTTVGRLKAALASATVEINIGTVMYVDYATEEIEWNNVLFRALYKRLSYEHEHEIRAILISHENTTCEAVSVALDTLIESIYVAPHSPTWFADLVEIVAKKCVPDAKITRSALEDRPLY
jgi:hypothetical protein